MATIHTTDFIVKKNKAYYDNVINSSSKYVNNITFLNDLKNTKEITYSDSTDYLYKDVLPFYINSDFTGFFYVNNSNFAISDNLILLKNKLDINNSPNLSFSRYNKITDLSYIKERVDTNEWADNLVKNQTDIHNKYIDTIIIKFNSASLTTLSNLPSDIIIIEQIYHSYILSNLIMEYEESGKKITEYEYDGTTYDTSTISDKITVSILNVQSLLIMIDTKDKNFTEAENFGLDNFGYMTFVFIDPLNSSNTTGTTLKIQIEE